MPINGNPIEVSSDEEIAEQSLRFSDENQIQSMEEIQDDQNETIQEVTPLRTLSSNVTDEQIIQISNDEDEFFNDMPIIRRIRTN